MVDPKMTPAIALREKKLDAAVAIQTVLDDFHKDTGFFITQINLVEHKKRLRTDTVFVSTIEIEKI